MMATQFEAVIGLETHVQLNTKSKMFSWSGAGYQKASPNTLLDPVSMALPGTLPVVNKQAVESAIAIGLALNCDIAEVTKFDRKQYTYPDLMKGYQISQYDEPICTDGWIDLPTDEPCRVGINRVHMEEDVARLIHIDSPTGGVMHSLLDINRAGVPLMEIVTEPDMCTPEQVEAYITTLQSIIRYLGVGTANMEEGSFRCDANISVRPKGSVKLGEKVEVKNMNRVRAVREAVEHEIERQAAAIRRGERIVQETRGWMDGEKLTVTQRSKEDAHDYRYFPEPDIPPLHIERDWVAQIQTKMPELPLPKKQRFMGTWELSDYDASLIVDSRPLSEYFEAVMVTVTDEPQRDQASFAKETANWLNGEMARLMHENDVYSVEQTLVKPASLAVLVRKFQRREINNNSAKRVFAEMFDKGADPEEVIARLGLMSVGDTDELTPIIAEVLANNQSAVDDYRSGKTNAIRFLMGQVMKATRGRADAQVVMRLLGEAMDD
jgi:aspartyl-tRNA(Asn)/glutamyl-tRNA(Gln) amidotransferase subunit B